MTGACIDASVAADPVRPVIRRFVATDAAAVRALFIRVNRELAPANLEARFEDYIESALREEIGRVEAYYESRNGRFFVAEQAGELAGMFGIERADEDVAELRRMYVDPHFRRHGIGRGLLERAEIEARALGMTRLILSTSELQPAAFALYQSAGFRLAREEIAIQATNKTVGGSIRRFHFEKSLGPAA